MTDPNAGVATAPRDSDATTELARRYAEALVGAAEKQGPVEPVLEELDAIEKEILRAHPRFASLLGSVRVSVAQKDEIISKVFEGRVSDLVVRFLRVLNRHERLGILPAVAREARALWDKRNNRIKIQVRTAAALDESQLKSLQERLAALTGATPILLVSTDPSLIGGLVVQVGDHRFDASVKNRLAQVRQRLIEGKMHEIQSRRDQFSYSA
jgi:F-type H+-transporting ATPase subunit delta